ncbi:MAG TPA: hypothetical protein ENH72_04465 [Pseudomonas sabulinigri]|uniref:Uncharacterized protein n=1 Tax=marine sediment metagenome TaxID=412755 RepID=A0A0F9VDT5_9ZZZZ|nr:hypothetical protein [Halopseudomonas sabulinigri]HEC51136.1 hypothetical protein [Halopseudomonas sabulinigri]
MQNPEMSLIEKLDNGLTKGLCLLLGWIKTAFIWLSGLISLIGLPIIIFEYGEGSADLSRIEWIFMPLMLLLLWRHVNYCKHFETGFWRSISRLMIFIGMLLMLQLVFIGIVAGLLSVTDDAEMTTNSLEAFLKFLAMADPLSEILNYGLLLITVYLSAPYMRTLPTAKINTEQPNNNENINSAFRTEPTL